jgi:hypothetical protein
MTRICVPSACSRLKSFAKAALLRLTTALEGITHLAATPPAFFSALKCETVKC